MKRLWVVLSAMLLGTSALAWNPRYPLPHIPCAFFPPDNVWTADISSLPVDPRSDDYVASIGAGTGLHPDFGTRRIGIPYAVADSAQTPVTIQFTAYGEESDARGLVYALLEVAAGAMFGVAWNWMRDRISVPSAIADASVGFGFGLGIELCQLFLLSGVSQGASVIARGLGIALGYRYAAQLPRLLSFALGVMFCVPGILWLVFHARWRDRAAAGVPQATPTAEEEILEGRIG